MQLLGVGKFADPPLFFSGRCSRMIVTVEEMKRQLGITEDLGTLDDELIEGKIEAAQDHLERLLGYKLADEFPSGTVPASLKEGIRLLAAHWYENREASIVGVSAQEIPYGVREIIREYRHWSF